MRGYLVINDRKISTNVLRTVLYLWHDMRFNRYSLNAKTETATNNFALRIKSDKRPTRLWFFEQNHTIK